MPALFGRLPAAMLVAACGMIAILAAEATPVAAVSNCDTSTAELSPVELQMLGLINAARADAGVPALKLSPALSRAAAWKSADRSAWGSSGSDPLFSHQDSLGRMPSARARDCGYRADAAENIAYGWGGVQATFEAWMASPGHRQNILMSYYVVVGIGEVDDRWTTDFGIDDDSGKPEAPPPTATPSSSPPPAPSPAPTRAPVYSNAAPASNTPEPALALAAGVTHVLYAGHAGPSSEVFKSLGGSLEFVYAWDETRGLWLRYIPGAPLYINSLGRVEPGRELIIAVNSPVSWAYPAP